MLEDNSCESMLKNTKINKWSFRKILLNCKKAQLINIFVSILFLILIAGLSLGVIRLYDKNKILEQQNQDILAENIKIKANLDIIVDKQDKQQKLIESLQQKNSLGSYINNLNIIEQLVNGADIAIKVQKKPALAMQLLNMALDRLNKSHDFNTIVDAIKENIVKIEQYNTVDKDKTLLKITQLMSLINGLEQTFVTDKQQKKQDVIAINKYAIKDDKGDLSFSLLWNFIKEKFLQIFHSMVTITHKETLPVVLNSTQLKSAKLNLNVLLLETSMAVNNDDNIKYHSNLNSIINLLQVYFVNNSEVSNVVIPLVQELDKTELNNVNIVNFEKTLNLITINLEQRNIADLVLNT